MTESEKLDLILVNSVNSRKGLAGWRVNSVNLRKGLADWRVNLVYLRKNRISWIAMSQV